MSPFDKYRSKGAYHYEWYKQFDWYKWFLDRATDFCKGKTIDVGCGDGLLMQMIQAKGYIIKGVDTDADGLALASEFVPIDSQELWLGTIAEVDEDFEYLACINAIEHMDEPEHLREFIRDNVSKGAIITTIDYQGGSLGYDHKFEWTYDEMMEFFKEFNPKGFRYKDTEWIGVEIRK